MSCLIPPPLLLSLLWKNCWYSLFILIPQLAILTELSKTSSSQTSMRRGTSILQNENFNLRLAPPRSEIFSWNSTKSISQCSTTVITMVTKRTCLSISCQPSCSTESSHRHEPQTYQIFWIIPLESNLLSCRKKYVDISLFFFFPPPPSTMYYWMTSSESCLWIDLLFEQLNIEAGVTLSQRICQRRLLTGSVAYNFCVKKYKTNISCMS